MNHRSDLPMLVHRYRGYTIVVGSGPTTVQRGGAGGSLVHVTDGLQAAQEWVDDFLAVENQPGVTDRDA